MTKQILSKFLILFRVSASGLKNPLKRLTLFNNNPLQITVNTRKSNPLRNSVKRSDLSMLIRVLMISPQNFKVFLLHLKKS